MKTFEQTSERSCHVLTLLSKLNLLRSRVSVALLSPWVRAPCDREHTLHIYDLIWSWNTNTLIFHWLLTRLSNLLATIDANLCSPASSDMRKTYSGAVTWLDLWVLPVDQQETFLTSHSSHERGTTSQLAQSRRTPTVRSFYLLTELLDSSVCAPWQLQCHVDSPPLVLHSPIRLQRYSWAGGLRDDGDVLVEETDCSVQIPQQLGQKLYKTSRTWSHLLTAGPKCLDSTQNGRRMRVWFHTVLSLCMWRTPSSSSCLRSKLPSLHPWTSASLWDWGFPRGHPTQSETRRWWCHRHYWPHDLYGRSSENKRRRWAEIKLAWK